MSLTDQHVLMIDELLESHRQTYRLYNEISDRQYDFLEHIMNYQERVMTLLFSILMSVFPQETRSSEIYTPQPQPPPNFASFRLRNNTIPRRTAMRNRRINGETIERLTSIINALDLSRDINFNIPSNYEQITIPTQQHIENACSVLSYRDCSSLQVACPIDMIEFEENELVMRIDACGHIFREANLRRVFQDSSKCPICRYNIVN